MKKLIVLLIAITCLICACGNGDKLPPTSEMNTETNGNSSQGELSTESAEEQMQKLIDYNKAMDLLNNLTGDYTDEQFETMENAYNILVKLGNYKDVPEVLSHFKEFTKRYSSNNNTYVILNNKNQIIFEPQTSSHLNNILFRHYLYVFNDKGLLIKTELTDYLGNGEEYSNYYTYEYNDANELVVERRYGQGDALMQTINYADYVYNSMGLITNKTEKFNGIEIKYTYVYNSQGKLTEEIVEHSNLGNTYYYYSYDANENLVSVRFESSNNPEWNNTTVYTNEPCYLYNIPN